MPNLVFHVIYLFLSYNRALQIFRVAVKNVCKYTSEFVLILIKQIIKVSFNNVLLHILFYLYLKSIILSLQLADLSVTLSLKLIIFSDITSSALNVARAETQFCDIVFLKNLHSF
jgi:hypothetical protein